MKTDEHRKRHEELHQALDELLADFITHHPDEHNFTNKPIRALMQWSFTQTIQPTEKEPKCQ